MPIDLVGLGAKTNIKWKYLSITLAGLLAASTALSGLFYYQNNQQQEQRIRDLEQQFLLNEEDQSVDPSLSLMGFEKVNLPSVLPGAYGAGTLTNVRVSNTNNFFGSTSWYVVSFRTFTAGTIAKVEMTFPAGFDVSQVRRIDNVGIPDGTMSASGQTVIYTVTTPVSIPTNTLVKIMMERIVNANNAALNQIAVTTRDSSNAVIDGPTNSATFALVPTIIPNSPPVVDAGDSQTLTGNVTRGGGSFGIPSFWILSCTFALDASVTDDVFTGYLAHEWTSSSPQLSFDQPDQLSTNAGIVHQGPGTTSPSAASAIATVTADDGIVAISDSLNLTCNPP